MFEAIALVVVAFCSLAGDLATPTLRPGKPLTRVAWGGAFAGALAPLLLLNCLFLFPFAIDPAYALTNEVFLAGVVAAAVDLPMTVYRNHHDRVPARRAALDVLAVLAIAGALALGWVSFLESYRPNQLVV